MQLAFGAAHSELPARAVSKNGCGVGAARAARPELRRHCIKGLRVALAVQRHHVRRAVHFERIVDVVGMPADIADLEQRSAWQLALDGDIPLMVAARAVSRIDLVSRVRLRLVGAAGNPSRPAPAAPSRTRSGPESGPSAHPRRPGKPSTGRPPPEVIQVLRRQRQILSFLAG